MEKNFKMKNIIRYIYHIILKFFAYYRIFILFIIPNLAAIYNKKLVFENLPAVQQLVKYSGKGKVIIGKNCSFGYKLGGFHRYGYIELQPRFENSEIYIGDNVATNNNIFICAANKIEIGANSLIGQYVTIFDFEAHGTDPSKRREIGKIGSVKIGNNVWIGNNVIILKNSSIGDNSIIAAGAAVSGSFPSNVVIAKISAIIMKSID